VRGGVERASLERRPRVVGPDPGRVEECRRQVNQAHQIGHLAIPGELAAVEDQRDVDQRVVQAVLVVHQAVVAHVLAVVSGDGEHRILPFPGLAERASRSAAICSSTYAISAR